MPAASRWARRMSMPPGRRALLDRAWRLSLATPAATVLESLAALGFGAAARSTALLGFGLEEREDS